MSADGCLEELVRLVDLHRLSITYFTSGKTTMIGAMAAAFAEHGYVIVSEEEFNDLYRHKGQEGV